MHGRAWPLLAGVLVLTACAGAPGDVVGTATADAWPEPLTTSPGDAGRGREIFAGRDANCLLCHTTGDSQVRSRADFGPPLAGVGARLSPAQIRMRIMDPTRLNPEAAMPAFYRTHGLDEVAPSFRGKTILTAQQVEDLVAYLVTLK